MKKVISLSLILCWAASSFAQLKFFTDNGKTEVKQGKCGMKDLMVRVPVPASMTNYEKARFYIYLSPKSSARALGVYYYSMNKADYAGKKTVDIVIKAEDGTSAFEYASAAGSYMEIDFVCTYEKRADQIFNLSFEWQGVTIEQQPYEEPKMFFASLQKFYDSFPFDFGKTEPDYYSANRSFSLKKSYEVDADVSRHAFFDESLRASFGIVGDGKYNPGEAVVYVHSYPSSVMSLEETKKDIVTYLTKMSSPSMSKKATDSKTDWHLEFFYPCYSSKNGKSGDAELDKKVEQMCTTPAAWQSKKVGNLPASVLEFPVIFDKGYKNDDGYKTSVSTNYEGRTRKLVIWAGELNGKIFVGRAYIEGGPPTPAEALKFLDDAMNSFKAY